MPKVKIVVVGSSNTDMTIRLPHLPLPGETEIGGDFVMSAGGKGANQAVAAARAGGSVTFVARVGKDVFGTSAIAGFKKDAIDVAFVARDAEAKSGVALIFVARSGENSIAVASGANAMLSAADVKRAAKAITQARILIMQLETPLATALAAASLARKAGVRVILNPAPAPAHPLPLALLRQISIVTPNETEAEKLTGIAIETAADAARAAERLLAKGVRTVIITLGSRGSFVATAEEKILVPAFRVRAVDTTGAGDVFNGALAVALGEGKTLLEAVRFASAAGAISITRLGAQPSAPSRAEIDSFLSEPKRSRPRSTTGSGRASRPATSGLPTSAPRRRRK
jgi:ribokinase